MATTLARRQQEQALIEVQMQPLVRELVQAEPAILALLQEAAEDRAPWERWHAYTALKRQGVRLVGFYAENPEIATPSHYEAFIAAIDALLPRYEDEVQEERTQDIRLYDGRG